MSYNELGLHAQGAHDDEGCCENTLEQCHDVHVFVLVVEQVLNLVLLGGSVEALCQRQQRAQELFGGGSAVDEPHQGLSQSDGQAKLAFTHFLAEFLLIPERLGVILDGIAPVAHLEHDVSLLAQRVHKVG